MNGFCGKTFRISRTTACENSSRPRAALKRIVPPSCDELAQVLDLGVGEDEVVVAGHEQERNIDRVEAGAGQRLGGVLVVVAVGQALVGQRDRG